MSFALDHMPLLRTGTGDTPKDGGCVIQVCSYLYNKEWRDDTPCVHPVLRRAAIRVNDSVDDETRRKLYLLIPRLMNTASEDEAENKRVSVGLAIWCAEQVFHRVAESRKPKARTAIQAAKDWFACPCEKHRADAYAAAADAAAYAYAYAAAAADAADAAAADAADAAAADAADAAADYAAAADAAADYAAADYAAYARHNFLVALLDQYDALTGRTETAPVTDSEWATIRKVMAG